MIRHRSVHHFHFCSVVVVALAIFTGNAHAQDPLPYFKSETPAFVSTADATTNYDLSAPTTQTTIVGQRLFEIEVLAERLGSADIGAGASPLTTQQYIDNVFSEYINTRLLVQCK